MQYHRGRAETAYTGRLVLPVADNILSECVLPVLLATGSLG